MKQSLYEPTIYTLNDQLRIKGFTMERPISSAYGQFDNVGHYNRLFKEFEASAVEYPVCEGSKKHLFDFCCNVFNRNGLTNIVDYTASMIEKHGVRIDELVDRLEVFEIGVLHREKQIRLRPEVKESEGFNFKTEREEFLWLQEQNRILWEFLENEGIDDIAQEFVKNYDKEYQPKQ